MKRLIAVAVLTLSFQFILAASAEAVTVTSGIYRQGSSSFCDLKAHFQGNAVAIHFIDNRFSPCTQKFALHATWDTKRKAYCTEMEVDGRYCFEVPSELLIRTSSRSYIYSQD